MYFSNDVIIHTFQQPFTERIKISRLLKNCVFKKYQVFFKKLSFLKTEYLKNIKSFLKN